MIISLPLPVGTIEQFLLRHFPFTLTVKNDDLADAMSYCTAHFGRNAYYENIQKVDTDLLWNWEYAEYPNVVFYFKEPFDDLVEFKLRFC